MRHSEVMEKIKERDYTFLHVVGPEEIPGAALMQIGIILRIPYYAQMKKAVLHARIIETLKEGHSIWYGIERKTPEGVKI